MRVTLCRPHLAEAEKRARQDQTEARDCFRNWAASRVEGARHMNVSSGAQVQQLLFAGASNQQADKGKLEHKRIFKAYPLRCPSSLLNSRL